MEIEQLKQALREKRKITVAKENNIPLAQVNGIARRLKLTPLSMYSDELKDVLIKLLVNNKIKDVAKILNINTRTVYYYMEKYDIEISNKYRIKRVGNYFYLYLKRKVVGKVHKDCLEEESEKTDRH